LGQEGDAGIAPATGFERLASALHNLLNIDGGLLFEARQQVTEQAGILSRGSNGAGRENHKEAQSKLVPVTKPGLASARPLCSHEQKKLGSWHPTEMGNSGHPNSPKRTMAGHGTSFTRVYWQSSYRSLVDRI
jgi:hypothetical protein